MEASGNIHISNVGSKDEQVNLTYSIKDVGTEANAEELKKELDEILKKKGCATTLDEYMTVEAH